MIVKVIIGSKIVFYVLKKTFKEIFPLVEGFNLFPEITFCKCVTRQDP